MNNAVNNVDIVYGADWGDGGKGKVSAFLSRKLDNTGKPEYDFVARWGGGQNAGHTVYVNNIKHKTHIIPSGIFYGIKSLIGPGCVFNPGLLIEEIKTLKNNGIDTSLLYIHPNAHIATNDHINEDKLKLSESLGTTSKGIAPAYAAKAARTGIRFCDFIGGKISLEDYYQEEIEFLKNYIFNGSVYGNILCEGAQGFHLDINWGNYPYVTSSDTLPYAACSIGFSPKKIRNIFAIAKIYDTRSGVDPLFPESLFENNELLKICDAGKEFGTTTGRRRKVNYLNLDMLIKALVTAGGTHLIISKCDILEEVGIFKLIVDNNLIGFSSISDMKDFIKKRIELYCPEVERIIFSSSPEIVEGL